MTYLVNASTMNGCKGTDDIKIKVYKGPEIYVPGAFTPNGDGFNDMIKAIPIGMNEFKFFNIYNRYGQLIFSSSKANLGWDGTIKGARQNTGTFSWFAAALDYNGKIFNRKGTFVLIR